MNHQRLTSYLGQGSSANNIIFTGEPEAALVVKALMPIDARKEVAEKYRLSPHAFELEEI